MLELCLFIPAKIIAAILKVKKVVSFMFAAGGGAGWESPVVVSGSVIGWRD